MSAWDAISLLAELIEQFRYNAPTANFQFTLNQYSVTAIRGNWVGAVSDNLISINGLTDGGAMTVEEAAKQTWTGMRARDYGYTQVALVGTPAGTAGHYTSVHVQFKK